MMYKKTRTLFCANCYLLRVQVKKLLKKHSLRVQALEKGEK